MKFKLVTNKIPKGSQPEAIKSLVENFDKCDIQTLLGITGSGKTFTIANLISKVQKPTLILCHNKTLAAQLFTEFSELFPENKVEYFVSYYDYYQPESFVPSTQTYIEKQTDINEQIERFRLRATASLLSHRDVIVISSVSCIYGLGSPINFRNFSIELKKGMEIERQNLISKLVKINYKRTNSDLKSGFFRVLGDTIEIIQGYETDILRIEMFGDEIETITILDGTTREVKDKLNSIWIYPSRHYVVDPKEMEQVIKKIKEELEWAKERLGEFEKQRLIQRVNYDIEMMKEMGFCNGIENYSRFFENRDVGKPPFTLIDYFGDDYLLIVDESHITLPQTRAMYKGDRSRKQNLIDYGFRLPSALDNRPLKFDEFRKKWKKAVFVSATPGDFELENSCNIVEQIIRPTGLLDPIVEIKSCDGQINDVILEIKKEIKKGNRTLVTTLTKKMAEVISEYLRDEGIKAFYLHSEVDTIERNEIIRKLRIGVYDVIVGINLLREGLDIPEVGFVAILDADKEGFLRNERSLIQTIGRAARNSEGRVILYANKITESIRLAVSKTKERRKIQKEFNIKHNITPKTITKSIDSMQGLGLTSKDDSDIKKSKSKNKYKLQDKYFIDDNNNNKNVVNEFLEKYNTNSFEKVIINLETEMKKAAENLDFETAIKLRDKIDELKIRYKP